MPVPDQGGHWGILGGTFDPVHWGHLTIAEEACSQRRLSGVLFVPAFRHPFKKEQCHAAYTDRLEMIRRALHGRDRMLLSGIEAERQLSGYTLDTIEALQERYPSARFEFIAGADVLAELGLWREPQEILKRVLLLVAVRPGHSREVPPGLPADRVVMLPTRPVDTSSRDVRARLKAGVPYESLRDEVPPAVLQYIMERELYR